jgi:response regulator RpfG family c-di-GMP phosphodiesterase
LDRSYRLQFFDDQHSLIQALQHQPLPAALMVEARLLLTEGTDLAAFLQLSPSLLRLPLLALQNPARLGDRMLCKTLGVDHFLAAPYTEAALKARLAAVVQADPQ